MWDYDRNIKLTSGYNFEGYKIVEYLDFCSGECALGTGLLSSLSAGLADFFGSCSGLYAGKLLKAKKKAISDLKDAAYELGANAIIGLDVDYTVFIGDIIAVVANGTAVRIEQLENNKSVIEYDSKQIYALEKASENQHTFIIPANNYYMETPIRPYGIWYDEEEKSMKIKFGKYCRSTVTAMNVNINFETIFHTQVSYSDINFTAINFINKQSETEGVPLSLPMNLLKVIQSCSVEIVHYISDGICYSPEEPCCFSELTLEELSNLRKKCGNDVVSDYVIEPENWTCVCGMKNQTVLEKCKLCGRLVNTYVTFKNFLTVSEEILENIESLNNAKEILDYMESVTKEQDSIFSEDIINKICSFVKYERMYGNMKDSCLEKLREYFENF